MGNYNDLLNGRFHPPKTWELIDELVFETDELDSFYLRDLWELQDPNITVNTVSNTVTVKAPVDFKTDLASVPRALWWLVSPFDIARAATIHDYLYVSLEKYIATHNHVPMPYKRRVRKAADEIFYHAMRASEPEIPTWKINICYGTVRAWGRFNVIGF